MVKVRTYVTVHEDSIAWSKKRNLIICLTDTSSFFKNLPFPKSLSLRLPMWVPPCATKAAWVSTISASYLHIACLRTSVDLATSKAERMYKLLRKSLIMPCPCIC